ncbi:MAG: hypothetical protein HY040_13820 [Planctomycetes bacterium]|nr:hypothetical protein [Planctomycetota bacterium]
MRLTSLILLAAIVGGAGYVLVFKRDWLFKKAQEGTELAQGYTPAATPQEAMDQFRKAIKERKFNTAAKYCTGDYAEQLRHAHDAANAMGTVLDEISYYAKDKGYSSPNTKTLLLRMDPFPTNFKIKDAPKFKGDDKKKAHGVYALEVIPESDANLGSTYGINSANPRMLKNHLVPANLLLGGFDVVREGTDESPSWKLNLALQSGQVDQITFFIDNYRSYHTGLTEFRKGLTNDRYESKKKFEQELFRAVADAK